LFACLLNDWNLHGSLDLRQVCGGNTFERGLVTLRGEQRAISVLQCADCGVVVGVFDGHLALEHLEAQVTAINAGLVRIAKALSEE
jgi:hypothetical protein